MAVASCPHCRLNLQINPEFSGQTLQCPSCHGAFIAPLAEPEEDEGFPLSAIIACVGGANALFFLVLAIVTSLGFAFFLLCLAILIEIAVWKREELLTSFQEVLRGSVSRS